MLHRKSEKDTRYVHMSLPLDHTPDSDAFFEQNLPQYYRSLLTQFQSQIRAAVSLRFFFLSLILGEALLLPIFFERPAFFAGLLGALFITSFSSLTLHFYSQAKKPEQREALKNEFIASLRRMIRVPEGVAEHHLQIAGALSKLVSYLHDLENKRLYKEDVFYFRETLLLAAIFEHLKQIKITPTDLEVHASLASCYVTLSQIYKKAKLEDKHRESLRLAMEEFSILGNFAPNDPWVHEQLATSYRDLGMQEEELREVETLLRLKLGDQEILYRLGALYFKQGLNAKGLQIYETLRKAHFKRAEDLIGAYGTLDLQFLK